MLYVRGPVQEGINVLHDLFMYFSMIQVIMNLNVQMINSNKINQIGHIDQPGPKAFHYHPSRGWPEATDYCCYCPSLYVEGKKNSIFLLYI